MKYYVTFGQQYSRNPHPKVTYAHPDGWLTIEADSYAEMREKAFEELGPHFATSYDEQSFEPKWFPLGELHKI